MTTISTIVNVIFISILVGFCLIYLSLIHEDAPTRYLSMVVALLLALIMAGALIVCQ